MYLWAKAAHVVVVVIWMSGMFSVAHRLAARASVPVEAPDVSHLLEIDSRWTVSAMTLAFALGFWMATQARWWIHPWFIAKFFVVLMFGGLHGAFTAALRRVSKEPERPSPRWHRHSPALLVLALALVAVLVIVKPG